MPRNAVMLALCLSFSFSSQVFSQTGVEQADSKTKYADPKSWEELFEKNAELAKVSPEQAKIEKNGWKQVTGMMDAYDEWLEELETEKTKTVIAKKDEDKKLDETVIALDGSIGAKKETVIAKKDEDKKLDETVIAKEILDNKLNLIKNIFLTAQNGSTEEQEKIRKSFLENDF